MNRVSQSRAYNVQGVLYALVIGAHAWLVATLMGQAFEPPYRVMAVLMGLFGFFGLRRCDLLTPWLTGRKGSIGTRLLWNWVTLVGGLLLIGYVTEWSTYFSRPVLLAWFISTPLVLLVLHEIAMLLARRLAPRRVRRKTGVLVFVNDSARSLARNLRSSPDYELVGFFEDRDMERAGGTLEGVPYLGQARSVAQYVRDHAIDVVFIVLPDDGGRRALYLLDELGDTPASVYYVPDFLILNLFEAQVREVEGVTVLEVADAPFYGADGVLKQGFDYVFAALALLLLAPLLLVLALMIKLGSKGPVLLRHKRYGLNGQRYWSYAFRTMQGAEADAGSAPTHAADARLTPVGRFLWRSSLDALPQLLNVLRGEMSVVGPRAHAVAHNEYYRKAVRRYMLRHRVKPGLTGWAQVQGLRGEAAQLERMEERIRHDLDYIKRWSPLLDLRIVAMTIAIVFRGRDA